MQNENVSAEQAVERLKAGNLIYLDCRTGVGDISPEKRAYTGENGQKPYAVILCCSDSRVIPESIFSAGIGELFVIRVAGNVVDNCQLGSIEYALEHLGCKLVMVLGHTGCGAVGAAAKQNGGFIGFITDEIRNAIGNETDGVKASILNIRQSVSKIRKLIATEGVSVCGALYHTKSGAVDFDIA